MIKTTTKSYDDPLTLHGPPSVFSGRIFAPTADAKRRNPRREDTKGHAFMEAVRSAGKVSYEQLYRVCQAHSLGDCRRHVMWSLDRGYIEMVKAEALPRRNA